MKAELENFANDIRKKIKFNCSSDYETGETPGISYTNLQGNTLELTFFSPETAYSGQYKLNGNPVKLNTIFTGATEKITAGASSCNKDIHCSSVSFHISGPVVALWAFGFAGFTNCPGMKLSGISFASSSARAIAPFHSLLRRRSELPLRRT